ncbi:iron ABC transporter permease [Cellulomonas aerilata]
MTAAGTDVVPGAATAAVPGAATAAVPGAVPVAVPVAAPVAVPGAVRGAVPGAARRPGTPSTAPVRRRNRVRALWLLAVLAVLLVLVVLSVTVGSRSVGWADVLAGVRGGTDGLGEAAVAKRVPRTVLAVVVGAALGLSGAVMQGVTRNPLADPGILGITMGASLAVVTGIAWFGLATATGYVWVAILGAAAAAVLVHTIGSLGRGGGTPLRLALAGAATSAALASFVTAVSLPRGDIAATVRSWQIGGVGGASSTTIEQALPFLAVGFAVSLLCARSLNSLALGDDVAAGLGERVALARGVAALGAVLLCGAATALAGPVGFVGLVVPHLCRLLVGVDHRWLLPFTALTGACLVVGADVVGRVVARPSEIDVGIVTALIGAPFFIHVVRRQRVRAL